MYINFLKLKINRLFESRKILKLKYYIHKFFREKDIGDLGFNFNDKPNRSEIIQNIIDYKKYRSFLEIGSFSNELFNKVKINNKVGVDPVSGGSVRMTSDEFFKKNKEFFDLVFIDGLHHYDQVKKDINNSLNILTNGGVILLHDCLPSNVFDQAVPRCTYKWNGDVWKAIVEARCRADIDTYTCYADNGIGIILKRSNRNILNLNTTNLNKLKFKDYYNNYQSYMNIINHESLLKLLD